MTLAAFDPPTRLNFVDGRDAFSSSGETLDLVNPSNGRPAARIPRGDEADARLAVGAARAAFDSGRWSDAPPSYRKRVLHAFADLIGANSGELDTLDACEMGKPVSVTRFNARAAETFVRFCAEAVDKLTGDVFTSDSTMLALQRRVPRGVVAAIAPWNFPTFNAVLKCAPALATGNTVVLKPSELASSSAVRLAQLGAIAGLPDGVLNVVLGLGLTVGQALALDTDVDMVTFTGSTAVGKKMLQYAGQSNLKVVLAECGGKSPHIVFDDGHDPDVVAASIAQMLLTNQGQICSVGSRLLVQRSLQDALIERIRRHFTAVTIGDPCDPSTTFGPIASAKQLERVLGYVEGGRHDGATLVVGGRPICPETGGFFVEPALFAGVSPLARIAQEEIFGPVLAVIPFDRQDEAVRIANGTPYGLTSYVWTTSLNTGMRMAKAIRSTVRVNGAVPKGEGSGHAASIEPAGQSGLGTEGGMGGLESYLRRQSVWFSHA